MKVYKIIAIKLVLLAGIAFFLSTEAGKQYADKAQPLVDMIISQ